jgi:hypothetical protein
VAEPAAPPQYVYMIEAVDKVESTRLGWLMEHGDLGPVINPGGGLAFFDADLAKKIFEALRRDWGIARWELQEYVYNKPVDRPSETAEGGERG